MEERRGKKRQDPTPLILFAIVVVIVIGYARIGVHPNWLFYPGEMLLIVGAAFTLWSYALLGRYLSAHVQVRVHRGSDWPCSRGFHLWQFSSLRAVCLPTEFATKKSSWLPSWETLMS